MRILLGLALVSSSAMALNPIVRMAKGQCVSAHSFGYRVVGQVRPGLYEMRGQPEVSPHAFFVSKRFTITSKGSIALPMRFLGSRELDIGDGFPTTVDFWQDCRDEDIHPTNEEN